MFRENAFEILKPLTRQGRIITQFDCFDFGLIEWLMERRKDTFVWLIDRSHRFGGVEGNVGSIVAIDFLRRWQTHQRDHGLFWFVALSPGDINAAKIFTASLLHAQRRMCSTVKGYSCSTLFECFELAQTVKDQNTVKIPPIHGSTWGNVPQTCTKKCTIFITIVIINYVTFRFGRCGEVLLF